MMLQTKSEHKLHFRKGDWSGLKKDQQIGMTKPHQEVFAFDPQKLVFFCVPYLSASEAYYCRQLSVYNLDVHTASGNARLEQN